MAAPRYRRGDELARKDLSLQAEVLFHELRALKTEARPSRSTARRERQHRPPERQAEPFGTLTDRDAA
jgi:hypothetical protein